ncbi:MAG: alpha-1,4-glucan--maltose-1-phosphate maltosyltransferase [Hyphomicrobium sp.]|jgi:starch synthase (maltosyl-transferring)
MHDKKPLVSSERDVAQPVHGATLDGIALSERVVIERVMPRADDDHDGRYASKATEGDSVAVECDIFSDGHETLGACLHYRFDGGAWMEAPMVPLGNDRWRGQFETSQRGTYWYTISAWRDAFATWCADARVRVAAGQSMDVELMVARQHIDYAASVASAEAARREFGSLARELDMLAQCHAGEGARLELLLGADAQRLFREWGPRAHRVWLGQELAVHAERRAAAFSAWYELMPRSQSGAAYRHGSFEDVMARLPYVRDLGFDVLYLMPIHPIGRTNRKGANNSLQGKEGDPGSPYAIGGSQGGHDAIHPELGSVEDFLRLVDEARAHGLEIALDFAVQCSLDHPWIKSHPEWFDWRPDGSIRYAENPPKTYEDIVNVHFYRDAFPDLWLALRDVVLFWVDKGVKIFRVDNPHTKPFPFWEWMIRDVQGRDPDVIFLSEAFTRPKIMRYLAKIGFSQSYSYFTWRNTKAELTEYLTELMGPDTACYMRPNFFANTPDINPYYLQTSGRVGFQVRFVLAATLGGNYGIYSGFELCEAEALPGREEYANSEKYQLKAWDWDRPGHIRDDIRLINKLRRESPALQSFANLTFYNAWNDHILYYGKATPDKRCFLLFLVNLDPHHAQGAHFEVPLWELGLPDDGSIDVLNVITGERFAWTGKVQHILLDPKLHPYLIFRLIAPEPQR